MYRNLKYEVREGIAYITVNRPKALNALNLELAGELLQVFTEFKHSSEAKAAIFTGEGRAFIAGADIAEMENLSAQECRGLMDLGHQVGALIESTPKVVIAAVNGFALGGGCELSMACDFRIASESAKFGQPEVNLGIIPCMGGTQRLSRLVGKGMANYLIMTGEMIDATHALQLGLVEKVVSPEALIETCEKIARTIIAKAPIAIGTAKRVIHSGYALDMPAACVMELEASVGPFATEDRAEGMRAFLEKRTPVFQGK